MGTTLRSGDAKWVALERTIYENYGLTTTVRDVDGTRRTTTLMWANPLCPAIRNTLEGQALICAAARRHHTSRALERGMAVVDTCGAGMMKIVIPLFRDTRPVVVVDCCGTLPVGGDVDSERIAALTGLPAVEIEDLARHVVLMTPETAHQVVRRVTAVADAPG